MKFRRDAPSDTSIKGNQLHIGGLENDQYSPYTLPPLPCIHTFFSGWIHIILKTTCSSATPRPQHPPTTNWDFERHSDPEKLGVRYSMGPSILGEVTGKMRKRNASHLDCGIFWSKVQSGKSYIEVPLRHVNIRSNDYTTILWVHVTSTW